MKKLTTTLLPLLLILGACQSYTHSDGNETSAKTMTASSQVEHGAQVYANQCAHCHGNAGQGSRKAPPLVGKDAFPLLREGAKARTGAIHNAMDIAAFATQYMPPDEDDRAGMVAADYWAVLAFALTANGVKLSEPVGPNNAASIVLHP